MIPQLHVEKMKGGYKFSNGTKVNILAYADDVCVIGKNKEEIEKMLKIYDSQWAGLHFNPAKCGCLSMINNNSRNMLTSSPLKGASNTCSSCRASSRTAREGKEMQGSYGSISKMVQPWFAT